MILKHKLVITSMPEAFGPLNIIVTILIAVVIQEWTDENTLAAFATMLAIEELGP